MKKETMMKILENPTAYTTNERLSAARLALVLLDLTAVDDRPNKSSPRQEQNLDEPYNLKTGEKR